MNERKCESSIWYFPGQAFQGFPFKVIPFDIYEAKYLSLSLYNGFCFKFYNIYYMERAGNPQLLHKTLCFI